MFKKFAFLCAVGALIVTGVQDARAGYITSSGDLDVDTRTATGTLIEGPFGPIEQLGFNDAGRLFTNQLTGSPLQPGGTVRTVGITTLNSVTTPSIQSLVVGDPSSLVSVFFAVEGTITGTGTAAFSSGSLFFASQPDGPPVGDFDFGDPSTWDFASQQIFGKFDLLPAKPILNGTDPASLGFAASKDVVNTSAVNGIAGNGDGVFVFSEDLSVAPDFLSNVIDGFIFEGLAIETDQVLTAPIALDSDDLGVLNDIAEAAFGPGEFFETGDYNPSGDGSTGDFTATLGATGYVLTAVPEPSSLSIFALMAGGVCFRRSNRRAKARS